MNDELTFRAVSETNRARCERWHPGFPDDGWTGADWSNAMQGEAGEAGNIVKKLRRIEFGLNQAAGDVKDDLLAKLAMEIGDTFMYLDLLAQHYGLNLADCVVHTFNRVSDREGFPERLPTSPEPGPAPVPMAGRDFDIDGQPWPEPLAEAPPLTQIVDFLDPDGTLRAEPTKGGTE